VIAMLKKLVEGGIRETDSSALKRGIIFSNCIALIFILVSALLFILIPQNHNWGGFQESLLGIALFTIPILLNRARWIVFSRLLLCWLPPILVFWIMILGMKSITLVPYSSYSGLRSYMLATVCIPYLVLERKPLYYFIMGVMPSFLGLFFCDYWLSLFDVAYFQKGVLDAGHIFAPFRSVIAYIVVSGSCLTLRFIVDRTEKLNQQLITELGIQNKIILEQAESELNKLNQQLLEKIEELSKREFILQQSQEIAKVGSWEFNRKDKTIFWSDEMYDIFGIDKSFDIKHPDLLYLLLGDAAKLVDDAHKEVLEKSKPYDFTLQTKTPIGYVKWVRLAGFPLLMDDSVIGITGIVHDVTVFKESEERIRASEKSYRALFEQANDAILISDFSGNFLDVNTAACKMLGYSKLELLQMNVQQAIDPEQLKANHINFERLALGDHLMNERKIIRKDGSFGEVEVNVKLIGEGKIMAIARDIASRKEVEREKEKIRYNLNERVKELSTLYKTSQILQVDSKPMHEVLQEVVNILPAAWQYPEVAGARISVAGMEFVTRNYSAHKHKLSSEFTTKNGLRGTLEVVYFVDRPQEVEGPFLAEERDLLTMLASMIQIYLNRRYETDALKRSEANQSATINNTSFHIWSVNRDYELIGFNKISAEFLKINLGIDVKVGERFGEGHANLIDIQNRWVPHYNRALSGETFKITHDVFNRKFEYSLNPIVEENRIIGVTVFGEDITDRLNREKDIQDANKLIGELQLMALRSVMNPHFIFNSLNAIQYYILENDAKSAVSYLSTFSKLIRAILSNSVKSKVRLSEELDMIKHYIQMESMRFDHKFDSSIQVNDEVDTENVEIPSMLVQPYVENAIIHGLYNKKADGTLKISVSLKNGWLLFEIEDDGVGRKASEQLRLNSMSKHKSMGTALTEERLRLINRDGQATVETVDLEKDGKPAGTKVNIWVKYHGP
jgi:PAS domain S-box-containing protein